MRLQASPLLLQSLGGLSWRHLSQRRAALCLPAHTTTGEITRGMTGGVGGADASQPTSKLLEAVLQSAPRVRVTVWSQAGMPCSPAVT